MENEKICKECRKKFVPYRKRQVFCSKECGHTYRYKHTPKKELTGYKPRICLVCAKEFNPTSGQQKYCCKECAKEAVRRRHYKYLNETRKKPCTEDIKPKREKSTFPASQRWERMSWKEISAECARFHITYGQAQQMYYSGKLPEDFGKLKIEN